MDLGETPQRAASGEHGLGGGLPTRSILLRIRRDCGSRGVRAVVHVGGAQPVRPLQTYMTHGQTS